jgi:hypothetical protein
VRLPCCLCACVFPCINVRMPELIFMKLVIYMPIMAIEPISAAYFINPFHQTVSLYEYSSIVARQRLGQKVTSTTNTHGTVEEWLDASFTIRSMSYQRRVGGSVRISQILVYVPPKRWSEGSQTSDNKIWPWVLWDSEAKITVLARANSNLLDWIGLCISVWLVGNGLVNTFPRQRRNVGSAVLYAARVVSKENGRLFLTGASCSFFRKRKMLFFSHCMHELSSKGCGRNAPDLFRGSIGQL